MKLPIFALAITTLIGYQSNPAQPANNSIESASAFSTGAEYGFTREKPIMVGGWNEVLAANIYSYLGLLKGPHGEAITYKKDKPAADLKPRTAWMV